MAQGDGGRRGGGGEGGIYRGEMGMPRLSGFGRQEMIGPVISHAGGVNERWFRARVMIG